MCIHPNLVPGVSGEYRKTGPGLDSCSPPYSFSYVIMALDETLFYRDQHTLGQFYVRSTLKGASHRLATLL